MRDKEKKHRKGQESTIGKIIYGFLLFMPLIAIGVTCGYAMFNKNAYKSYSGNDLEQSQYITDGDNLVVNETYHLTNSLQSNTTNYGGSDYYITLDNFKVGDTLNTSVKQISLYISSNGFISYTARNENNAVIQSISNNDLITGVSFKFISLSNNLRTYQDNFFNLNFIYKTIQTQPINNVFYYSVDKVTESPLFSWAQNSVIYTTTNATCNALSITTPFIPLLLSYWLIISVIYFLYDIALMLVWLIHRKIHELQESL